MASLKERLIDILVKNDILSRESLDEALKIQQMKGGHISDILVDQGIVNRQDLMVSLSQELGIPPIDLSKYSVDSDVVRIIPRKVAERYEIIPISKMGKSLTVAMADPLNVLAIDEIKSLTGYRIDPIIATRKDIQEAIEQHYGESSHAEIEELVKGISKQQLELVDDEEYNPDVSRLFKMTQDAPVVKVTNAILAEGTRRKASDILIEPLEKKFRIRYRIDGVLQEVGGPPKSMHPSVVSRIKVMSQLNIAERRLPQDGRFKVKFKDREVDYRVSILPSSFGEKVALRILDKSQVVLDIDKLGFEQQPLKDIKQASKHPHGMILVCGPTGSGKTTTLYSILKYVDSPALNLVTVEDPVEFQLEGINQVTARPSVGFTFAAALRSILRQDPDVIMIGEIRDFETVDIAIKSALTGHLVLSTLHTNTASGATVRLLNMNVEPFLISSSVIAVAAQRLVRKICLHCKEFYEVRDTVRKQLELDKVGELSKFSKLKFFRGKGCSACFNTGYSGRVGIIEVLVLSPEIKELIESRAQETEIREVAKKAGMNTLRENGLAKVSAGITTLEEVLRVTVAE